MSTTKQIRQEFEQHCGVFIGAMWSDAEEKYIPDFHCMESYLSCIKQNALFAGWKAHCDLIVQQAVVETVDV